MRLCVIVIGEVVLSRVEWAIEITHQIANEQSDILQVEAVDVSAGRAALFQQK